jgi:hypothetical protein
MAAALFRKGKAYERGERLQVRKLVVFSQPLRVARLCRALLQTEDVFALQELLMGGCVWSSMRGIVARFLTFDEATRRLAIMNIVRRREIDRGCVP